MNTKPIKVPSYIAKQFLPDEYALCRCKPYLVNYFIFLTILTGFLLYWIITYSAPKDIKFFSYATLFSVIFLIAWIIFLSGYIQTELILTNKRVMVRHPFVSSEIEYINLEEIRITDIYDQSDELTPLMYKGIYRGKSANMITVSIRSKKGIELVVRNIGRSDYKKFQELLTEECKKLGNNIS